MTDGSTNDVHSRQWGLCGVGRQAVGLYVPPTGESFAAGDKNVTLCPHKVEQLAGMAVVCPAA